MAMRTQAEIERYAAKHDLRGALRTRVRRDGETLHILLLGVYPNLDAARKAAANLPPPLRDVVPWVRSVGSLQRLMRNAG